jgi:hypothetical protein
VAKGGMVVGSTCDVGVETSTCVWMVEGDDADRRGQGVSGQARVSEQRADGAGPRRRGRERSGRASECGSADRAVLSCIESGGIGRAGGGVGLTWPKGQARGGEAAGFFRFFFYSKFLISFLFIFSFCRGS